MTEDTMAFLDAMQSAAAAISWKELAEAVLHRLMDYDVEGSGSALGVTNARTNAPPSATAFASAATTRGLARWS